MKPPNGVEPNAELSVVRSLQAMRMQRRETARPRNRRGACPARALHPCGWI